MAFSGTLVNSGRGEGMVVATGDDTEIGRIQEMVAETEQIATPLMQQVTRFGRYLSVAIILLAAALVMCAGTFGLFLWMRQSADADVDAAQTVAVNTLVLFEAFYLLNVRHIDQSVLKPDLLTGNRYVLPAIGLVVLFQLIFTYVPFMHRAFGTAPLEAATWLYIVPVTASVFVLVELEKWLMRLQRHQPGEAAEESAGAVR
ncbi:MAG: cation transporting ATPase C-terminal domain-containing protein [Phycisphaeraceae bacterium]